MEGRAAAVVLDAQAYQLMLNLAAEANAVEGIRQGFADQVRGCTEPACVVFDDLRAEFGLPG